MQPTPALLSDLIDAISAAIEQNAEAVTALDQAIGDGDHVYNLQRGLEALTAQAIDWGQLDWAAALQKIGMILMSKVGGASGSLYGTLFIAMSKAVRDRPMDLDNFAEAFGQGVEAVKARGKADLGEKTMLDVMIPVANTLRQAAAEKVSLPILEERIAEVSEEGVAATRDMVAMRGRAAFLGERAKGHIDAGAKTSQLMICAVAKVLAERLVTSS